MAFNHRKLSRDSASTYILGICGSFCEPEKNTDGYCPPLCISFCSPTCNRPLIPPPDPSTTASDNHPYKNQRLHLLLIISLSILAASCSVFCCYTFYKFYKKWDRSRRRSSQPRQEETHDEFLDEDHGPMLDHPIWYIRTVGLQPSTINSITVCKYKRSDGLVDGTECSVCLNEFQEDETLRLLPKCNHAFHIPCIDTWLRSHTNCPMCRAGIVTNTAGLPAPAPEQSVDNPVVQEEAQVVISESSEEFRREREDGDWELRIETEEEGETQIENGAKSPETSVEVAVEGDHLGVDGVQPKRRSVSMDSVSASRIIVAIANAHPGGSARDSGAQLAKVKESNMGIVPKKVDFNQSLLRFVGSSSIGRSLQKGPISMKRSLSCSGKILSSRYSRSRRNSLLPS